MREIIHVKLMKHTAYMMVSVTIHIIEQPYRMSSIFPFIFAIHQGCVQFSKEVDPISHSPIQHYFRSLCSAFLSTRQKQNS